MARIWANRLEAGTRTWDEVPLTWQEATKNCLRVDVKNGKITAKRYEEITGEPYIG